MPTSYTSLQPVVIDRLYGDKDVIKIGVDGNSTSIIKPGLVLCTMSVYVSAIPDSNNSIQVDLNVVNASLLDDETLHMSPSSAMTMMHATSNLKEYCFKSTVYMVVTQDMIDQCQNLEYIQVLILLLLIGLDLLELLTVTTNIIVHN